MKIQFISNRYYLTDSDNNKIKMIPAEYKDFALKLKIEDLSKKRLTLNERLQLEIMRFKSHLRISEQYVWELIKGRTFRSIRFVSVKFGDDRHEASFDGLHIVCPKKLFQLAYKALYPYRKIKSMS